MDDFRKALRLQIACFYAECIRQTFSGEWHQDDKLGLCLKKVGNQNVTILPLSTAEERMNGDDLKLFAAANCVCREVFKQVSANIYGKSEPCAPPNAGWGGLLPRAAASAALPGAIILPSLRDSGKANKALEPTAAGPSVCGCGGSFATPGFRPHSVSVGCGSAFRCETS